MTIPKSNTTARVALLVAFAIGAFAAFPAAATDTHQEESGNATSVCHTALPQFDNPIRFRPLAVANEGTQPAFVTCSFRAPTNSHGQEWFRLTVKNLNPSGVLTINCTGVAGVDNNAAVYMPRSITVPAGGRESIAWAYGPDNGGNRWQTNTGVSCALPPGAAINEASQGFTQL